MLKGRYTRRLVDYSQYQAPRFKFNRVWGRGGCGAYALGVLTNSSPTAFYELNKGRRSYSDAFMVKQLRSLGCTVIPLKWKELNSARYLEYPISPQHVVLVSQVFLKREASWLVYHGGVGYHSGCEFTPTFIDAVNKPIVTAYLVWHPAYRAEFTGLMNVNPIVKKKS
jgi:hypothetical protein